MVVTDLLRLVTILLSFSVSMSHFGFLHVESTCALDTWSISIDFFPNMCAEDHGSYFPASRTVSCMEPPVLASSEKKAAKRALLETPL